MSNVADNDEELGGCELGTKEYWEKSYSTEIINYVSHGDVGEVWFDEDSQFRVITWMIKNDIKAESKIIDLGLWLLPRYCRVENYNSPFNYRMRKWYDAD